MSDELRVTSNPLPTITTRTLIIKFKCSRILVFQYVNERCFSSEYLVVSSETKNLNTQYFVLNTKVCGEYRSRTDDLLRARQAL